MKFKKKPVVVEAEQYFDNKCITKAPEGVCFASQDGCIGARDGHGWVAHIHTLEGPLIVSHLDWIITGVKGEKYPCKPDIFEATYEEVEE